MLTAKNLSFGYTPDQLLFSHLSFAVRPGEIWHLRGDNGAGKTTLFKGLLGLLNLRYEWLELTGSSSLQHFRQHTTYMPAEGALGQFSYFAAATNLQLFTSSSLSSPSSPKPHLQQQLEAWGFRTSTLQHHLQVRHFSTGMRQRLACLRTQLSKRPLWIMDEPTRGLDQRGQALLKTMILHHQTQGGATLIASHHQTWINPITTHILELHGPKCSHQRP